MSHYSFVYCFITMPIKLLKWELLVAPNGLDLFLLIVFLHYKYSTLYMLYNQLMLSTLDYGIFLRFLFSDFFGWMHLCLHVIIRYHLHCSEIFFYFFFSLLFHRVIFLPQLIKMCQNGGNRSIKSEKLYTFFFFTWNNMNTGYIFVLGL